MVNLTTAWSSQLPDTTQGLPNWRTGDDNSVLITISCTVFGFPVLIATVICLVRLRVYIIKKRDKALGRTRTLEYASSMSTSIPPLSRESSILSPEILQTQVSTIKETHVLSTISEFHKSQEEHIPHPTGTSDKQNAASTCMATTTNLGLAKY